MIDAYAIGVRLTMESNVAANMTTIAGQFKALDKLIADATKNLKDMGAATKLSVSQISSIERGANLPSIESLLAICRAFQMKPSDVLASIDF